MRGVLSFNFLSRIWQVRTLLPVVTIKHSKCLLTLGNALSVGAQCYSKMLYLQVFLMRHMVGGCWKLSCALCFIGLQLCSGALSVESEGPAAEGCAAGAAIRSLPGSKDRIKPQPEFFCVEVVPPCRAVCSPLPRRPPCLQPLAHGRGSSLRTRPLPGPRARRRRSQRLGLSAARETKKLQLAQLFKRSCNMLLLWVIAGFFYTDITIIILSSRKN